MSQAPLEILLLRHGPTDWNEQGLYQGRRDIALSVNTRALLRTKQIPETYKNWDLFSSPLQRATETAQILFDRPPMTDAALSEVDYGEWEGQALSEIKTQLRERAPRFGKWGWEDRPPRGESYIDVWRRLESFLPKLKRNTVIVTHRGVMLTFIAKAWDWDIESKAPHKVNYEHAQLMQYDQQRQKFSLRQLNMAVFT